MKKTKMRSFATRDSILKLLSDDEIRRVSAAEAAPKMAVGDEYLEIDRLDKGVRKASGMPMAMARVLPRKAVAESTWTTILAQLTAPVTAATPAAG